MFQSLQTRPSTRAVTAVTLLAVAATSILFNILRIPNRVMVETGGYDIVDYELAFTPEKASAMLAAWGAEGQAAARQSLLVDFAFMPAYALTFAGITLLAARSQIGGLLAVGLRLAPLPILAALLDALENLMLRSMLGQATVAATPPLVAGVAASLKFLILLAAILFWVAALGAFV